MQNLGKNSILAHHRGGPWKGIYGTTSRLDCLCTVTLTNHKYFATLGTCHSSKYARPHVYKSWGSLASMHVLSGPNLIRSKTNTSYTGIEESRTVMVTHLYAEAITSQTAMTIRASNAWPACRNVSTAWWPKKSGPGGVSVTWRSLSEPTTRTYDRSDIWIQVSLLAKFHQVSQLCKWLNLKALLHTSSCIYHGHSMAGLQQSVCLQNQACICLHVVPSTHKQSLSQGLFTTNSSKFSMVTDEYGIHS